MKKYSPPFWAAVKADYCSGARSVEEIKAYYGVSPGAVYTRRKKESWQRSTSALPAIALTVPELEPAPSDASAERSSRERLAPRLTRLMERAVAEIELAASESKKDATSMDRARDVRTLGTVMRLMDHLERGLVCAEEPNQMEEIEQNENLIRQEIAGRLRRLHDAGRTG